MSKHDEELLSSGLPARDVRQAQLTREDLRSLVRNLTMLRGHFELPETHKSIDDTLEIVYALTEDWVRQAAERERQKNNRRVADRRQRT